MFLAPLGKLLDQTKGEWFVVGDLDGALAGLVFGQTIVESFYGLAAGVNADMSREGGEMNQIPSLPECGNAIRHFLRGIGKRRCDCLIHLIEARLHVN